MATAVSLQTTAGESEEARWSADSVSRAAGTARPTRERAVAVAMRLTHDRQLSEDIVQEVLLKAWKDPSLGSAMRLRRAWLFTASNNHRPWRSGVAPSSSGGSARGKRRRRDQRGTDRWLIAGRGSLSVEHRYVISAAYYEGRSVADTARPESRKHRQVPAALRTQSLRLALQRKRTRP